MQNDDDIMIKKMEKLLKAKPGELPAGLEDDGLDYLIGYKEDAEGELRAWRAENGEASSEDEVEAEGAVHSASDEEGSEVSFDDAPEAPSSNDDTAADEGLDEPQYISRAQAYGDNAPLSVGSKGSGGKYLPPSKRRAAAAEAEGNPSEEAKRNERFLRGLVNRLNVSNLSAVMKDIEGVFERHSTNQTAAQLSQILLAMCDGAAAGAELLLAVNTGCVAVLHHTIGPEVSARFLEGVVVAFERHHAAAVQRRAAPGAADEEISKECSNLARTVCLLYNLRVVHSTLVLELIDRLVEAGLDELGAELLLVVLRAACDRLRIDDSKALRAAIDRVGAKGRAAAPAEGSRLHFLLTSIDELRSRRKVPAQEAGGEHVAAVSKAVRSVLRQRKLEARGALRVPWADLLAAVDRGRWWLVGTAWLGRGDGDSAPAAPTASAASLAGEGSASSAVTGEGEATVELMQLAAAQRMTTDVRRRVFCAIMGAEDYVDGFGRLAALGLPSKQDREVVRVLLDCCLQQRTYSPYYALLAVRLCQHDYNHKISLQYALWDRFKEWGALSVPQTSHLARFVAHVIAQHALSLAVLKAINFHELPPRGVLAPQLLIAAILTHHSAEVATRAFERISVVAGVQPLKDGLLYFIKHYLRGWSSGLGCGRDAGVQGPDLDVASRQALLKQRLRVARKLLQRNPGATSVARDEYDE